MKKNGHFLAFLCMVAAICSLCTGSSVAKSMFPVIGASGTSALRVLFGAIFLWLFWRPWRYPRLSRADFVKVLRYGAVLGLMNWLFYCSLKTIPLGVAVAIELLGPLSVALFASRRGLDFLWLLIAAIGLSLLLPLGFDRHAKPLDLAGILYALGAAACWGAYIIFGKRAEHLPSGQVVAFGMAIAAMVIFPIGFASAGMDMFQPKMLAIGGFVGIVSSAIPYSLEFAAIKMLPRATFGILAAQEPAVAGLFGWLLQGEILTHWQMLAIAIVICAAVGAVISSPKSDPAQDAGECVPN